MVGHRFLQGTKSEPGMAEDPQNTLIRAGTGYMYIHPSIPGFRVEGLG